jgi:hypothetical protein
VELDSSQTIPRSKLNSMFHHDKVQYPVDCAQLLLLLSDPSVATTIPLHVYAVPTGPNRVFREERHPRSRGTTPSQAAVKRIGSSRCFSPRIRSVCVSTRATPIAVWLVQAVPERDTACTPFKADHVYTDSKRGPGSTVGSTESKPETFKSSCRSWIADPSN